MATSSFNMPGYTGYRPQHTEPVEVPATQHETGSRIPGYCGYVSGVKSENIFGTSYGKATGIAQ